MGTNNINRTPTSSSERAANIPLELSVPTRTASSPPGHSLLETISLLLVTTNSQTSSTNRTNRTNSYLAITNSPNIDPEPHRHNSTDKANSITRTTNSSPRHNNSTAINRPPRSNNTAVINSSHRANNSTVINIAPRINNSAVINSSLPRTNVSLPNSDVVVPMQSFPRITPALVLF